MRLVFLANRSTEKAITGEFLDRVCVALNQQAQEFAGMWDQVPLTVTTEEHAHSSLVPDAIITIYDDAEQVGELGDHELTAGKPAGRIFARTILNDGGSLSEGPASISAVISHEFVEIAGDPYADFWSEHPSGDVVALETADPVEDESYTAENGIALSNFVGPRWFREGEGPFDRMGTRSGPFEMSRGGYIILRSQGPVFAPGRNEQSARLDKLKKALGKERLQKRFGPDAMAEVQAAEAPRVSHVALCPKCGLMATWMRKPGAPDAFPTHPAFPEPRRSACAKK